MISFNNALNIISDFWRFLTPFINITEGIAINSFIIAHTGVSVIEITRP